MFREVKAGVPMDIRDGENPYIILHKYHQSFKLISFLQNVNYFYVVSKPWVQPRLAVYIKHLHCLKAELRKRTRKVCFIIFPS